MIDWDEVFGWQIWQVCKWITGALILSGIVEGIYLSCIGQIGH